MTPYYERDGIVIYHGDCREILPTLSQVEHVITDPPYDERTHAHARTAKRGVPGQDARKGLVGGGIGIEFDPIDPTWVTPLLIGAASRWVIAFCALEMLGHYACCAGSAWVRACVWARTDGAPQFSGDRPAQASDGVAVMHAPGVRRWNGGGSRGLWLDSTKYAEEREHPTQKPESLMRRLVSLFTDPGETILDPFMGSGTTLRAAKDLGRKAIGIELSERWCEVAARRLEQTVLPLGFEQVQQREGGFETPMLPGVARTAHGDQVTREVGVLQALEETDRE